MELDVNTIVELVDVVERYNARGKTFDSVSLIEGGYFERRIKNGQTWNDRKLTKRSSSHTGIY